MTNDELNKLRQFWIFKGTSNFCNELDYDIETEKFVKCRPDGFYDIVSTKDTIQGGIHVIELDPMIKMMEEMAEALDRSKETSIAVIETDNNWTLDQERIGNIAICSPLIKRITALLESYQAFKRENGLEEK